MGLAVWGESALGEGRSGGIGGRCGHMSMWDGEGKGRGVLHMTRRQQGYASYGKQPLPAGCRHGQVPIIQFNTAEGGWYRGSWDYGCGVRVL